MIKKELITSLVNEWLNDNDYFLVDVSVSPDMNITVEIDHKDGVWIEDCVELSKFIESKLNRDEEDFELEVGSAGIGQPFKVAKQYENHIGDEVEVLSQGKKIRGVLKAVADREFTVTVPEKQKLEGQKKAQMVEVDRTFSMDEVNYCKYLIKF